MKIHINQIPVHGLHIEGEEKGDILDIQDALVRPLGPVRYSLDVGLSDGGLFATGELEADIEFECVVCLERFEQTLRVPNFAVQVDLGTSESVDLTEEVREDILLALPYHPHCDWDGKKACTGMRHATLEQGAQPSADPSENEGGGPGEKNPWATLDELTKPKPTNP